MARFGEIGCISWGGISRLYSIQTSTSSITSEVAPCVSAIGALVSWSTVASFVWSKMAANSDHVFANTRFSFCERARQYMRAWEPPSSLCMMECYSSAWCLLLWTIKTGLMILMNDHSGIAYSRPNYFEAYVLSSKSIPHRTCIAMIPKGPTFVRIICWLYVNDDVIPLRSRDDVIECWCHCCLRILVEMCISFHIGW